MSTKPTWTAEDIIRAVHGECLHEQTWTAHGVSTDSRSIRPGDLFIALTGPVDDGHDDVASAFAAGAVAAIVSRQVPAPPHAPQIIVEDTLRALEDLGRAAREQSGARVIAVTGFAGKTGSKDMLRLMLNEVGDTHADEERLSDSRGVPLSLARMPAEALYGVFEMSMNRANDPAALSRHIAPHIALVTTSESGHIDYFDLHEEIDDTETGVFAGMDAAGTAVLNRDDDCFPQIAAEAKAQGIRKILSFGRDAKADARLLECIQVGDGSDIRADILGRKIRYRLGTPGIDAALNSLGALLAAAAAGANIQACAAVLSHYRQAKEQNVIRTVAIPGGTLTLIDESRDASPFAVHFAIRVLGQMPPGVDGRRILVLSDMEGLAEDSPSLHADLAQDIGIAGIDLVFGCGEMMRHLFAALLEEMRGFHAMNSEELARHVARAVRPGDIVTVKGAPGMRMNAVIEALEILGMPDIDKRLAG